MVDAWVWWSLGALVLVMSVFLFVVCGVDKRRAGTGQRRVPETVLLTWALAGGSPGLFLGMVLFRHKVRKPSFLVRFFMVVGAQLVIVLLASGLLPDI